ncbi:WhiB family transcriptional regulator [Streptomyces griseoluteus]|uniref:WhiB family transcriptional regulator n=1 Tax=Streptomyces griseoluteus TaxID=29306 RepID=A0A4Z1CWZ4_STRGP|nr:WhiB family transcriptional regulator [Streptomyces griseoluteus]TGN73564.1 WhiB family transcriptional regulator [Streptomyces griseoluteus]GHF35025.1 hypothetical protein GCM10017776_61820 [Streptomyces griseoluteus]
MRRSGFPHLRGSPLPAPAFRGRTSKRRSDRSARTPPAGNSQTCSSTPAAPPLKKKTTAAKALCARCPVSDACTAFAIGNDSRDGIWGGGLTVDERDQLARERATAIADEN